MKIGSQKPTLEGELGAGFPFSLVAGVDEVGRGCLVGSVVTASVVLPVNFQELLFQAEKDAASPYAWILELADSKLLSEEKREELFPLIQKVALAFSVSWATPAEIDELNIHHATLLAMKRAVESLSVHPQHVLVDGKFKIPGLEIPCTPLVKGDRRSYSIAAASILAKVTRDRMMKELDLSYPQYGFGDHKGYPTSQHLKALSQWGILSEHRKSFGPVRELLGPEAR
jgi:ribonuclease HII